MSNPGVGKPAKPLEDRRGHSLLIVRLIALERIIKAVVLLFLGVFMLHMLKSGTSIYDMVHNLVNAFNLDENGHWIHTLLEKTLGLHRNALRTLSIGSLVYAGLYTIEGIGLFFDQAWAEWITVISTGGFIPVEAYELFRHVTLVRVGALVVNILILVYIAMRLHWRHLARKHAREHGASLIIPHATRPTGIKP